MNPTNSNNKITQKLSLKTGPLSIYQKTPTKRHTEMRQQTTRQGKKKERD